MLIRFITKAHKYFIMNASRSLFLRSSIIALLMVITTQLFASVTPFQDWSKIYTHPVNTGGTNLTNTLTYSIGSAPNRLLIVAIAAGGPNGTVTSPTVTWGGKSLTACSANLLTNNRAFSFFFYLKESDIASASGSSLVVNMGATSYYGYVTYAAVYSDVDQSILIRNAVSPSISGTASNTATATANFTSGDQGVFISSFSLNGGTQSAAYSSVSSNWTGSSTLFGGNTSTSGVIGPYYGGIGVRNIITSVTGETVSMTITVTPTATFRPSITVLSVVPSPFYFRSVTSGNWSSTSTWEQSADGVTYSAATMTPIAVDRVIIRNGHTVTLTAASDADSLAVNNGGALSLSTFNLSANRITMEGGGSGSSASITGSGTLTLGGDITVTDNGGGTNGASISCPVALGANRNITVADDGTTADDLTISGIISGAFNITKLGAGTLALSGTNTYSGTTAISAGIISITNAAALGTTAAGTTVSSGAALNVSGSISVGAESLSIAGTGPSGNAALDFTSGTNVWGGTITLTAAATIRNLGTSLTINNASSIVTGVFTVTLGGTSTSSTISGAISGTGGINKVNSTGQWTLSGNNTYSGTTVINAGEINLGSTTALGTSSATTVVSGATLDIGGFTLSTARPLTINGNGISSSGALINSGAAASYSGTVALGSDASIGGSGNITLSGVVSGAFSLTKTDVNTLTLSNTGNTLGTTGKSLNISNGTVSYSALGSLGSLPNFVLGSASTSGKLTSNMASTSITLTYTVSAGGGTLENTGTGHLTYSGAGTLNGTLTTTSTSTGRIDLTGALTSTGSLLVNNSGTGSTRLGSTGNTYSGTTTVQAGVLAFTNGSRSSANSDLILAGGTFVLGDNAGTGYSQTMKTLTVTENSTLELSTTLSSAVLTLSASNGASWTSGKLLTVNNWGGTAGVSGTGAKINIGTSASGLTYTQQAQVYFTGFGSSTVLSTGEVVPSSIQSFRSAQSGAWATASNWEYSPDNTNWATAAISPATINGAITIQSPHTITVGSNVSADQVTVNSGATLAISNGFTLTIANGSGTDLTVDGTISSDGGAISATGATITMGATSNWLQTAGTPALPPSPIITWTSGSTLNVSGSANPTNINQTLANFIWNSSATKVLNVNTMDIQAGNTFELKQGAFFFADDITATLTDTWAGNLLISGGTFTMFRKSSNANDPDATLTIGGTLTVAGGTLNVLNCTATATSTPNATLNVTGKLTISSGIVEMMATAYNSANITSRLNVGADFDWSGGTIRRTNNSASPTSTIDFNKTGGTQLFTETLGSVTYTATGAITWSETGTSTVNIDYIGATGTAFGLYTPSGDVNITISSSSVCTFPSSYTIASGKTLTLVNSSTTLAVAGTLTATGATVTLNGDFRIDQGGFGTGGTWTYASGCSLIFNYTQTGTYGPVSATHNYWPASSGPTNVVLQMQNSASVNAGALQMGVSRTISGTLSSSNANGRTMTFDLNGNSFQAATLTVGTTAPFSFTTTTGTPIATFTGNININANLSTAVDLKLGGDWTKASSSITFTPNSKAVYFIGTGNTQTITVTGGGTETFAYFLIDKPTTAGTVTLASGTNMTISGTTGNILEIKTTASSLDLNGNTLNLSSTGGSIYANSVAASIIGGANSKISVTNGTKTFANTQPANTGSWSLGANVTLEAANGVAFGSNITTLNGIFKIISGGFASGNTAPIYASGSTLEISTGGSYALYNNAITNESGGWFRNVASTGSAQQGVPWNFKISTTGTSVSWNSVSDANPRYINGSLTINSGCTFTLGTASSGDLFVRGDITNSGTLAANGRLVTLNGSGAATLTGTFTGTSSFEFLTINKSSNNVTLANDININQTLTLTNGLIVTGSNSVTVASGGSATGYSSSSYVSGLMKKVYASATSFIFPIGKGGVYRPLTFNYTSLTGTSTVSVEQFESAITGTLPSNINLNNSRYWDISQSGGSSINYKVTLDGTGDVITGTVVILKKESGTITSNAATTPNYTNTSGFTTLSGTNSFTTASNCQQTANAGSSLTGASTCGLTTVTLGATNPTYGSGVWSIISGLGGNFSGNSTSTNPTASFTGVAGSTYTLRWSITNGNCSDFANITVTFNQNPTTSNAGTTQTFCISNVSTTLAANTPTIGTGTWSISSGPNTSTSQIDNVNNPAANFSPTVAGTYVLTWTITNSPCTASASNVTINVDAAPTTANAGSNQTGTGTCGLTTVNLGANTPSVGTGQWSIVSGTGGSFSGGTGNPSNSSISNPTFSGVAGNSYTLRWTITNGTCSSTSDINVTFNINPTTADAGTNQTGSSTCGLTTVTLAGNTPSVGTGLWSVVSGTGGSFSGGTGNPSNSNSPTASFSGTAGSAYVLRWTITNGVCTSSSDVNVTFNISPTTADAGPSQTGSSTCGLTTVTLAANSPSIGTGQWAIVSGTGGSFSGGSGNPSNSDINNPTFSGTAGNSYTLRWTITNGVCTSYSDMNVTFNIGPSSTGGGGANAGSDQTGPSTCGLTTVSLNAVTPSVGTGQWSIVSGSGGSFSGGTGNPSNSDIINPTFSGTAGASYVLRWALSYGVCGSSADINIVFNVNPTAANAGTNQSGSSTCGLTSVTLNANTPSVGTGLWSIVSGSGGSFSGGTGNPSNSNNPAASFSGTAGNAYVLRWTTSNMACTSTSDVNVSFNLNPTAANAGSNQTFCSTSSSTVLAANSPTVGTGTWSVVSGPSTSSSQFSNVNDPAATFTYAGGSGVYTLRWTISNSPCTASTSDVVISVTNDPSSTSVSYTVNSCDATGTASPTISGASGGTFSSSAGLSINPTTGVIDIGASIAGAYTINYSLASSGGCSSFSTSAPTVTLKQATWTGGGTAGDWTSGGNWNCSVEPPSGFDIVIPGSASPYPTLTTAKSVHSISLTASGASITVSGTKLNISGAVSNSGGTFDATNGTLNFNGASAQTINASHFVNNTVKALQISNSAGVTIANNSGDDSLRVVDTLTFGASNCTLYTNDNLVFVSSATGNARIPDITRGGALTGNAFSGNVVVERYHPAKRAWRLMTSPLSTTNTIFQSWQNNGVYTPGLGTFITGTNANPATNGLDATAGVNSVSMRMWNANTQAFQNVTNTLSTYISPGSTGNSDNIGYFMFIRGDRNPDNMLPFTSNTNNTLLRSKGKIQSGVQSFTAANSATGVRKYTLIGNPYISPLNFASLSKTNLLDRFYSWDPTLNQVGAYVTVENFGGTYISTAPGSTVQTEIIQTSQAFFVEGDGTHATASISINESDKSGTYIGGLFRPQSPLSGTELFRSSLYLKNTWNSNKDTLADANLAAFNDSYSAAVTSEDAVKFTNTNETFALLRSGISLSVEKRPIIGVTDTLYFNLTRTSERQYEFAFIPNNLNNHPGLGAFLEDTYRPGIQIPVSLSDTTRIPFVINADAGSKSATRFRIVFIPLAPVPVLVSDVRAYQKGSGIEVNWKMSNELNIARYEVEKSADGSRFVKLGSLPSGNLNAGTAGYTTFDPVPYNGDNFYRIRIIYNSGNAVYSKVVKVTLGNKTPGVAVYPNPVRDGLIGLQLSNLEKGNYQVSITNTIGQLVDSRTIVHNGGSAMETISTRNKLSAGVYQVELRLSGKKVAVNQLIVE